jgi:hypothetical protein
VLNCYNRSSELLYGNRLVLPTLPFQAASRRTEVVEMVVLLQAQQGMPEEVAEELIGELWSLQYRSPGG